MRLSPKGAATRQELIQELHRLEDEQRALLIEEYKSVIALARNQRAQERVRRHLSVLDRGEGEETA